MRIVALAAFVGCMLASLAAPTHADEPASPQVTLLAAGSGAKAPLRYQLAVGATQTLTLTMDLQLAMSLRTGATETLLPRARLPKTRFTLDLRVLEVAADGAATLEYRHRRSEVVKDPKVEPAVLEATGRSLAELAGLAGRMVVSTRGFVREHRLELPAKLSPEAQQSLENLKRSMGQLAAPLPEEPVGKGARWQAKTTVELNGAVLDMVSSSELTERKGKRAKIKTAIEQTSGRQELELGGIKSRLVSALITATGHNTIDLGGLAPRAATVKGSGAMQLEAMGQGVKLELSLSVAMEGK